MEMNSGVYGIEILRTLEYIQFKCMQAITDLLTMKHVELSAILYQGNVHSVTKQKKLRK